MNKKFNFIVLLHILCVVVIINGQDATSILNELSIIIDTGDSNKLNTLPLDSLLKSPDSFYRGLNPISIAVDKKKYTFIPILRKFGFPPYYIEYGEGNIGSYLVEAINKNDLSHFTELLAAGIIPVYEQGIDNSKRCLELWACADDSKIDFLKILLPSIDDLNQDYVWRSYHEIMYGSTSYLDIACKSKNTKEITLLLLDQPGIDATKIYGDLSYTDGDLKINHYSLIEVWNVKQIKDKLKYHNVKSTEEIIQNISYNEITEHFPFPVYSKTISRLKLRKEPSLSSEVLDILDDQKDLYIIKTKNDRKESIDGIVSRWYYVITIDNQIGWIYGGYVKPLYIRGRKI